jgi:hypothetical protein
MKRASVISSPLELYPLMLSVFRDSTVLTFSFLAVVFLICL